MSAEPRATTSSRRKRWGLAVISVMVCTSALSGCSSTNQPLKQTSALTHLQAERTESSIDQVLPVRFQSGLLGEATSNEFTVGVALNRGTCAVALKDHDASAVATVKAPTSRNDPVETPTWPGASNSIGAATSVEADLHGVRTILYCGIRGIGVRIVGAPQLASFGHLMHISAVHSTQIFAISPSAS